jgi:hypothetical protein
MDSVLEESQSQVGGGRDASSTGGGFPTRDGHAGTGTGTGTGSAGENGDGSNGDGSASGASSGDGDAGGSESTSGSSSGASDTQGGGSVGGNHGGAGSGSAPSYGEDSETFRRQICEAARSETDPELREALERECRKYGGTPR